MYEGSNAVAACTGSLRHLLPGAIDPAIADAYEQLALTWWVSGAQFLEGDDRKGAKLCAEPMLFAYRARDGLQGGEVAQQRER